MGKGYYVNSGDELLDIAYTLYLNDKWEQQVFTAYNEYWLTQEGFKFSDEKDKYYELANIVLRKRKIERINDKNKQE